MSISILFELVRHLPNERWNPITTRMKELLRSNDLVTLSFVEALMRDAGIAVLVADQNMSIIEGSIGAIPRRVLVDADDFNQAERILTDAGLAHELKG